MGTLQLNRSVGGKFEMINANCIVVKGSYYYKKHYFSPLAVRRVYSNCTRSELLAACN
jgi:hypothetical protein